MNVDVFFESSQVVPGNFEPADMGLRITPHAAHLHKVSSCYSAIFGSANATTLPPAGRPDFPPPAEITTYCRPFTM